jgi:hypothetical protein
MQNLDQDKVQRLAQEAFNKVSGDRRWETAIVKAKVQLETNPLYALRRAVASNPFAFRRNLHRQRHVPVQGVPEKATLLASRGREASRAVQRIFALKRNGIGERANAPYPFTLPLPTKKGSERWKA